MGFYRGGMVRPGSHQPIQVFIGEIVISHHIRDKSRGCERNQQLPCCLDIPSGSVENIDQGGGCDCGEGLQVRLPVRSWSSQL